MDKLAKFGVKLCFMLAAEAEMGLFSCNAIVLPRV